MRFVDRGFYGNQIIGSVDLRFGHFMALNSCKLIEHTPESIMSYITGEEKQKPIHLLKYAEDYYLDSIQNNGSKSAIKVFSEFS